MDANTDSSVAYPLRLEPYLSPRLWGGKRLESFLNLGEPFDADEPLGESWQVYAKNRIKNGNLAGRTFEEVAKDYGAALLGTVERGALRFGGAALG